MMEERGNAYTIALKQTEEAGIECQRSGGVKEGGKRKGFN